MNNQNTDNKIQQNEAQQPANATVQPTAEQGAEQTEQNTRHYLNSYAILKFGEKKNYLGQG